MGAALCLLSAAGFGAMAIFGKLAYDAGVSPGALLLVRFTLAAVLLGIVLLVRPGLRRASGSPRGEGAGRPAMTRGRVLAVAIGLGAIGYATQASLFFSALQLMDASLLALILYTYPVMVTVVAVLLGRDRLTPARGAALAAASGGTLLVLLGAGGVSFHPLGALLAFTSAITYTVYILVADTVVHRLAPVVLSALVMTGAAGTLGARALLTGGVDLGFGVSGWFWLACIAVVSTVVAMLTFFAGLKRTGPSTAAILSTFEPVVTAVLAALILGESLTPVQLAGGALVLSSVAVLQLRRAGTRRQDQSLRLAPVGVTADQLAIARARLARGEPAAGRRRSSTSGPANLAGSLLAALVGDPLGEQVHPADGERARQQFAEAGVPGCVHAGQVAGGGGRQAHRGRADARAERQSRLDLHGRGLPERRRRDIYVVDDDAWYHSAVIGARQTLAAAEITKAAGRTLGLDTPGGRRLARGGAFLERISLDALASAERWRDLPP
ncbi:DMT family transporter [Nonomuraea sp. NPDC002799]